MMDANLKAQYEAYRASEIARSYALKEALIMPPYETWLENEVLYLRGVLEEIRDGSQGLNSEDWTFIVCLQETAGDALKRHTQHDPRAALTPPDNGIAESANE